LDLPVLWCRTVGLTGPQKPDTQDFESATPLLLSPISEFPRGQTLERSVRTPLIVIPSPVINLLFGIINRIKPMSVQTLLAEPTIEGFDDCIVRRLSSTGEINFDLVAVSSLIHHATGKL
jgi:hypothetical protein